MLAHTSSHQLMQSAAMPPLETMHNDEAFLNLLSSQRELLTQLNRENAMRREQHAGAQNHLPAKKRGSFLGMVDPLTLMNRPIIERRGSIDLFFSRRMSLGMGNDSFILPNMYPDQALGDFDDAMSLKGDLDFTESPAARIMKRRRSSLGLFSSLFFEDPKQARRFSMASLGRPVDERNDAKPEFDTLQHEHIESSPKRLKIDPKFDPSIDPETLKKTMEAFAAAMERSAKSQQDIHDWDRKMGLKRSHSKTMRLSSRSRKKLRTILKKEMNTMVAATR